MQSVKYVSGCMVSAFGTTDGSNRETVPANEVAKGAIGYCLVFDNIKDAVNFDDKAEVRPFVMDVD